MADRWNPENAMDGRYLWLPIEMDQTADGCEIVKVAWHDKWDLSVYGQPAELEPESLSVDM